MEFIATCPKGFEPLLASELRARGVAAPRPLTGQVAFAGGLEEAYAACLWSRLASRVALVLGRFGAADTDALYEGAHAIAWEEIVEPGAAVVIEAHGTNAQLRSERFIEQRLADALRDRMLARIGARVQINPRNPDVPIMLRLSGERATVSLVLSGAEPLFRRGARADGHLRPDYAAAMAMSAAGAKSFSVPWRNNPALEREALAIARNEAPGLGRFGWGFERWRGHDEALWRELSDAAAAAALPGSPALADPAAADAVLADLSWLADGELPAKAAALEQLSALARAARPDARIVTLARAGLLPERACESTIQTILGRDAAAIELQRPEALALHTPVAVAGGEVGVLVGASDQFAARLSKVARARAKWARRADVNCYRVYDADLPDYAVSIELYQELEGGGRWLSISEYAPPKEVDPGLAERRLMDVLAIAPRVLDVDPAHVSLRVRSRERGGSQYADLGSAKDSRSRIIVDEGGLAFELDFSQRLDRGIFLDHRDTRAMLREMMKRAPEPKRFLNLFAYTGTATCYAADGGALCTTTVDLSQPSLDIARRNMERNGFTGPAHEFIRADALEWIRDARHSGKRWDLIFCDVPTFSNSSRMRARSFDVQRDHVELLINVSRLLAHRAQAIFSCNLRSFSPDRDALAKAGVELEEISSDTIPEDFSRTPHIHRAYIVRRV